MRTCLSNQLDFFGVLQMVFKLLQSIRNREYAYNHLVLVPRVILH